MENESSNPCPNLILFDSALYNGGGGSSSSSSGGIQNKSSRVFNYEPAAHKLPIPKYLEIYFSETTFTERTVCAKCNECGIVVKGSFGVTSNFLRHLRQRHPHIQVNNPGRPYQQNSINNNSNSVVDYQQTSASAILSSNNSNDAVADLPLRVFSNPRQRVVAEAILKWLTTDMLPLSLAEQSGFHDFCKTMDSTYVQVNRQTLSRMLTGRIAGEIIPRLKSMLNNVEDGNLHLSVNIWAKESKDPRLFGIRVQYIADNWDICKWTLGYVAVESHRQERETLLPTCAAVLGQYGIDLNKVGTLSTVDAWQTLQSACFNKLELNQRPTFSEELEIIGQPRVDNLKSEFISGIDYDDSLNTEFECFQAENLPSIIDALLKVTDQAIRVCPCVTGILSEIKLITDYGKRNIRWQDNLVETLDDKLTKPFKNYWNSQLDLLQWFTEESVFTALTNALSNAWAEHVSNNGVGEGGSNPPQIPSQELFFRAKSAFSQLFSPLAEAVETLQAEGALASLIIPAMCGIIQSLNNLKSPPEQVSGAKQVIQTIIVGIQNGRCKDIRQHTVFILATILDPRFKLSVFSSSVQTSMSGLPSCERAIQILNEAYEQIECQESSSVSHFEIIPSFDVAGAEQLSNKKIFSFYIDKTIKKPRRETEVELYLSEEANSSYNPLSYWKHKSSLYPRLSSLAKKVLGIPTDQGSPERLAETAMDICKTKTAKIELQVMEAMMMYREHV